MTGSCSPTASRSAGPLFDIGLWWLCPGSRVPEWRHCEPYRRVFCHGRAAKMLTLDCPITTLFIRRLSSRSPPPRRHASASPRQRCPHPHHRRLPSARPMTDSSVSVSTPLIFEHACFVDAPAAEQLLQLPLERAHRSRTQLPCSHRCIASRHRRAHQDLSCETSGLS